MLQKLEKKFGRYAIKNLSKILIFCYVIGYLIALIDSKNNGLILQYLSLNPYSIIHRGQIWRLFTWVLIPPYSFDFWTIITLIFYYSIGKTLERIWGDFYFNVYIFSGMLFTLVGSFLMYGYLALFPNEYVAVYGLEYLMQLVSTAYISTYYINMSLFLAFACTFPNNYVLLMFVIPVKMKWLGVAYTALLAYECVEGNWFQRIIVIMSLLNFLLFFLVFRNGHFSPRQRMQQRKRQAEFTQKVREETVQISKHKCAVCGRTELDNPDLTFRFCSKCNGNYEYCSDHLFTHMHVE